jgi:hypothetical protein
MSSGVGPTGAASAKLPLWDAICRSYSIYFYNFPEVLRISWLWLVVAVPLLGFSNWLRWSWMAGVMANLKAGLPPQPPAPVMSGLTEIVTLGYLASLIVIFAGVSIAVAWHRRIILDEHPGFSGSNVVTKNLWRYVGVGVAIFLICVVPALIIMLTMFLFLASFGAGGVQARASSWFIILTPVIFLLYLAVFAIFLRLSLLFPARAVGDTGLTFKEAWRRTRGNTWRMFWGIVACTLPPLLVVQIAFLGLVRSAGPDLLPSVGRMAAAFTTLNVYVLLVLPIGIGFLSYCYRHFIQRA